MVDTGEIIMGLPPRASQEGFSYHQGPKSTDSGSQWVASWQAGGQLCPPAQTTPSLASPPLPISTLLQSLTPNDPEATVSPQSAPTLCPPGKEDRSQRRCCIGGGHAPRQVQAMAPGRSRPGQERVGWAGGSQKSQLQSSDDCIEARSIRGTVFGCPRSSSLG